MYNAIRESFQYLGSNRISAVKLSLDLTQGTRLFKVNLNDTAAAEGHRIDRCDRAAVQYLCGLRGICIGWVHGSGQHTH